MQKIKTGLFNMWDKANTYLYAVQYVAIDYYFLFTIYPTL